MIDTTKPWSLTAGDCIGLMSRMEPASVDLVFADPPFNIGQKYDVYYDNMSYREYIAWSAEWMGHVDRVLKPTGSFWLAIGDEYAAELAVEAKKLGFKLRNWVVWYYTFGPHQEKKFTRSHTHILYFVVGSDFTWNPQRVPSARQEVYKDRRAKAGGRIPDDTWILRPSQFVPVLEDDSIHDVWYFPRLCGTFKERQGWHGCQMPVKILERIIASSSNPGDVILDPFSGSGTTLIAGLRLGRRCHGIDISTNYVEWSRQRVEEELKALSETK